MTPPLPPQRRRPSPLEAFRAFRSRSWTFEKNGEQVTYDIPRLFESVSVNIACAKSSLEFDLDRHDAPKVELEKAVACIWMAFSDIMDIEEALKLHTAQATG